MDATEAVFSFLSVAGVVYQPQTSLALDAIPAWSDFGDTVLGTGGVLPISVSRAGANKLFFRLEGVVPRPDGDGDGLDSYEEALFGSSDSTASTDADLLTDMEEFQLRQLGINVHPAQEFTEPGIRDGMGDSDGDGITDLDELRSGTNAVDPRSYPPGASTLDTDQDGLPDSWEMSNFGSITAQNGFGNPDGDRLNNQQEFLLGLDPNEAVTTSPRPSSNNGPNQAMTEPPYRDGLADQDSDNVIDIWELEDGTDPKNGSSFDIQKNFVTLRGRLEHLSTFGAGGQLVQ